MKLTNEKILTMLAAQIGCDMNRRAFAPAGERATTWIWKRLGRPVYQDQVRRRLHRLEDLGLVVSRVYDRVRYWRLTSAGVRALNEEGR
jgi:DNA-binding HxlR family transcriptional regulator